MKRTTILADEDLLLRLRLIAKRRRVGTSAVIREALAEYVAKAEPDKRPRAFSFIAMGDSGHTDTGKRAKEIVAELIERDYLDAKGPTE